jgi:cellulose synthase operon protein C
MRFVKRRAPFLVLAASAALLVLTAPPVAAAVDSKAEHFYEDALTRYDKHDYSGAIIQLKNALQRDKTQLAVQVLLGKALFANGDVAAAEVALNESLRLGVNRAEVVVLLARSIADQGRQQEVVDPQRFPLAGLPARVQAQLLLVKAAAYSDLGNANASLKAVEDARAVNPQSIDSWLAEVPIRIRRGQWTEALAAADKAVAMDPSSADAHYQRGSVLHVQGNLVAALTSYDKAIAADPAHVDARVARAGIDLDLKRYDAAAKDVATLLDKTPDEPRGWYLSALLAEHAGRPAEMKAALARITALLDPVPIEYIRFRPQILLLNGEAHYGLGEREKAKPFFEYFQQVQPGSPVSKLLASIYLAEGNNDRAIDTLDRYVRAAPKDTQALTLLASARMAKGQDAVAASLMQEALRSNDAPELRTAYGLSLIGTGQTANAQAQLEAAYKADPGQTQAAVALVGLYLRSNQSAKALAVAKALVARQPANPGIQNLLGMAKARNRDVAGARAAFEQAIKLNPALLPASLNLARLEMNAGNLDRAQSILDGVLKAHDRDTEAMREQAALAERRNQPVETLRWLQKAYDTGGATDVRSGLALVDLQLRRGRRDEALKVALQVSAAVPDDLRVLLALARAELANADFVNAKATLTNATTLANYEAPVQVEIALLQLAAHNLPGAAYCLDKALSSSPEYLPAQVLMSEVEWRQGDFAKAESRAQQIIKRVPKLAIGYSLIGDVSTARGQPGPAVEAYRKAFQVQPSADTMGRLFQALAGQDLKTAVQLARQWIQSHPDDVPARKMLAEAYVRTGNMAAARQEYEHLRALAPKDAGVLNNLANVLLRLNDAQALPVAEQALALAPDDYVTIDTTGWAAYHAGKLDRAVQLLRDARLRSPESGEVRYHLAAALVKIGRKDEARDELTAALRGNSGFDGRDDAQALLRTLK